MNIALIKKINERLPYGVKRPFSRLIRNKLIKNKDFVHQYEVVSRFFRKFISSASKYRHQMYGFSSSAGCSISILNRCSMSI